MFEKMRFTKKKSLQFPDKNELHSRMQLKQRDKQLLQMMFAAHVTPGNKSLFFNDLDIEKEPIEFNLMLAHLSHRHGSEGIPSTIVPRIRGVARFYLFKNATLFSSFGRLAPIFHKAGIPLLLLKGAAIKAYYDPHTSRCLEDVDFAVPKERLDETIKIAENQGFYKCGNALHSIDMKQPEINGTGCNIDIHHRLLKTSFRGSMEEELTEGARLIRFFGTEVWIPSPENLLLHILENEFFNLCITSGDRRRFKWIYDCGMVLSSTPQLDWLRLVHTAKKYSIHDAIQPMLSVLADYLPQYVQKNIVINPKTTVQDGQLIKDFDLKLFFRSHLQSFRREKLRSEGKKWRYLFLWPSHISAKYRVLNYHGKVDNLWRFILLHSQSENFYGVISWLLTRLLEKKRNWNR